jgi:hypothetical protein
MIQLTRRLPGGNKDDFWVNPEQIVWVQKDGEKYTLLMLNGPEVEIDHPSPALEAILR